LQKTLGATELTPEESSPSISRRTFLEGCAAVLLAQPAVGHLRGAPLFADGDPAGSILTLDRDWLFGGKWTPEMAQPAFNDSAFASVTLPHSVTALSWKNWHPDAWQDVWAYRRHFSWPAQMHGQRIFLRFDRVVAAAKVTVNGNALPQHLGGFLPFDYEITDIVREQDNVISVAVDARWLNVPPAGSPRGPQAVDYLLPGGITGSVHLHGVPHAFIRDVVARATNVLTSDRKLEVTCQLDSDIALPTSSRLVISLRDGDRILSKASRPIDSAKSSQGVHLTLKNLQNIVLWDVERPRLYDLDVTLFQDEKPLHRYRTRIGIRDARFELDGFYLNGKRLQLFGLNRHELYPYLGYAAPPRLLRRDAEILRHRFHCNIVRCSHYPQSAAFLDACDELGLLVWEEIPGWQYIGDAAWQECAVRDVEAMVRRDRNRPSVVIWGVRINESSNNPALYRRTRELAKSLDPTRPTSGTMTPDSLKEWRTEWHQDVFAFDDYHAAPDGSVGILPPLSGVPYLLAEAVGQFNYSARKGFDAKYRRAGDVTLQQQQALRHAEAHSRAADYPRCAGVIAWCAFDYASLMNADEGVKCPGIADVFRTPKLGASFYLAQIDPGVRPVIEPNFYWDFGRTTPTGPGEHAAIFSNCDRLEISVGGRHHATLHPDRAGFPHLKSPPFFADLAVDGTTRPELRIDGYVGTKLVLSRSFSSDRSMDRLHLHSDDMELVADGSDATWLTFGAADKFGTLRPFVDGEVALTVEGPGRIVGDNPFQLTDNGGSGAVMVQTTARRAGRIRVTARHSHLGTASIAISVRRPSRLGSSLSRD
jgi:beta-galactosidase